MKKLFSMPMEEATDGTEGGGGSGEIKFPENWKDALPEDIKAEASLQSILDIPTLAKSFVNAQRMVGKDKIILPDKHATEDDWNNVFSKLGRPEKAELYDIKRIENSPINDESINALKEIAHKTNMLPHQLQELVTWQENKTNEEVEVFKKQLTDSRSNSEAELKKEWGAAYDKNVQLAQKGLGAFADEATVKYLQESGIGNDINLIKMMTGIGKALSEDTFKGIDSNDSGGTSPAEAQSKINSIMGNKDHPYNNHLHPNHKNAVKEMQELFGFLHYGS